MMRTSKKVCKVCGSLNLASEKYCDCGARLYDYLTVKEERKVPRIEEGEEWKNA